VRSDDFMNGIGEFRDAVKPLRRKKPVRGVREKLSTLSNREARLV
jgi:hypothetical protein